MSIQNTESTTQKLSKTIFKNTAFALVGSSLLKIINFLFGVYIIRQLGDQKFGQYSIVVQFVGLFQIFAELGMSQYVMREIARDRQKTQSLILNLIGARLLLALTAIGIIPIIAAIYGYSQELVIGVLLYTSTFLLSAIQAPLLALLTANERFDLSSAMNVIGQITFVVLGGLFLLNGLGFMSLIVASIVSLIPQIALGLFAAKHYNYLKSPLSFSPRTWPRLVRSGLPFGMISLALTIAFGIDTVILSKFVPEAEVGWYNVAYSLIFSILFLSRSFREAMVPSLTRVYVHDEAEVHRWYFRMVKAVILLSLPIAVGGVLIAEPLVHFLYTEEFAPVIPALRILIWDVPFLMFASFGGSLTTVIGSERTAAKIYGLNAALNVILNLLFIPLYGYIAASIITVLTDLVGALQFHYALRNKLKLPSIRLLLIKVGIAVFVMGLGIYWLRELHFIILIFIGVILYGMMVLLLRLLDESEWNLIRKLLSKIGFHLPAIKTP